MVGRYLAACETPPDAMNALQMHAHVALSMPLAVTAEA
jgi:hypothetical protein